MSKFKVTRKLYGNPKVEVLGEFDTAQAANDCARISTVKNGYVNVEYPVEKVPLMRGRV